MDLGQQSNLGSLISAVLVGLLALGSSEFARMDRSAFSAFINDLQGRARNVRTQQPVDQGKLAVEQAVKQIAQVEAELSTAFDQWKEKLVAPNDPRFKKVWKAIHTLVTQLDRDAELREALPAGAHVDYVWVLFRAAEMNPVEFSSAFVAECDAISATAADQVKSQAAVLSIYHGYDPRHPNESELTHKLEQFARANPDNMIGVFLYLLISRELYDVGQRELAERILQDGIRVYQDYPDNIGRLKLLNELMDQRMSI